MLHARHTSLSVLGLGQHPEHRAGIIDLSQDVIFASGRPSLLLPDGWSLNRLPEKIVIGWNASREAARAIADAMPFLSRAKAVHLMVVPEPKISHLLGQEPGADISLHLARHGVPVTLDRFEGGDAGQLMMTRAREIGAELIVMALTVNQGSASWYLEARRRQCCQDLKPLSSCPGRRRSQHVSCRELSSRGKRAPTMHPACRQPGTIGVA